MRLGTFLLSQAVRHGNVTTKSVLLVLSCFDHLTYSFFWRSRCRRRCFSFLIAKELQVPIKTREKYLSGKYCWLLYSWKFFPSSACFHWLLRGHMTSNNETVSRHNLWAGNIAKSMTSEGKSALLPANVDARPPPQRGLMNSSFEIFSSTTNHWSLGKLLILLPRIPVFPEAEPRETLRFCCSRLHW